MNILFTVCGRAGSKGIKSKNTKKFLGYPLSYYTFASIMLYMEKYTEDDIDIVISSDSEELIKTSKSNPYVAVDIIRRKEELCRDNVAKFPVILDSLAQMEKIKSKKYDMVVDLDLTSPLRTLEDIKNLIETHKEKKCDVTLSVTEARRNPYFNMVKETEKGVRKVFDADYTARQQAPVVYDMNASLYAYSPNYLRNGKGVLDGYCEIIKMMDTGILDLDHEADFELMEVVAKYLFSNKPGFREIYEAVVGEK